MKKGDKYAAKNKGEDPLCASSGSGATHWWRSEMRATNGAKKRRDHREWRRWQCVNRDNNERERGGETERRGYQQREQQWHA